MGSWDQGSAECAPTNSCAHVTLTLNDVGDHQGGAGVVANETTTSQVVFNLQGKQVPGERKREGTMEKSGWEEETGRAKVMRLMHTFVHT